MNYRLLFDAKCCKITLRTVKQENKHVKENNNCHCFAAAEQ